MYTQILLARLLERSIFEIEQFHQQLQQNFQKLEQPSNLEIMEKKLGITVSDLEDQYLRTEK